MPKTKSVPFRPLADRIGGAKKPQGPLWAGPSADGPLGGVTQSMLQDFLRCRERFRIKYVLGLQPSERWDHRIGYGNMWHVCEEELANPKYGKPATIEGGQLTPSLFRSLTEYAQEQCRRFPLQQQEIEKWYNVCRIQFPHYVAWWAKHPDVQNRTPLLSEYKFDIPYRLPSGRVVRLRGKWDSVDLVQDGKGNKVWLMENKAKGEIDVPTLEHQLKFDIQTMLYFVALDYWSRYTKEGSELAPSKPIAGVRYNAILRPLSGGKGTIKQGEATLGTKCGRKACKERMEAIGTGAPGCDKCGGKGRYGAEPAETMDEYMARLSVVIGGAVGEGWGMRPDEHYFFCRINVEVSSQDTQTFRRQFLDPILEQLCDWWDWVSKTNPNVWEGRSIHWRNPFGVYYSLDQGGTTEYDHYLETGSEVGLRRTSSLFPELR